MENLGNWLVEQEIIQRDFEDSEELIALEDQELIKLRRTTLDLMKVISSQGEDKEEP